MSKPVEICGDWNIAEGVIEHTLEDGCFLRDDGPEQSLADGYQLFKTKLQEFPAWVIDYYSAGCDYIHLVRIITKADSDEYMADGGREKVLQLFDELPYPNYATIMEFSITQWGDYYILAVGRVP
jgi:hypothetical protein